MNEFAITPEQARIHRNGAPSCENLKVSTCLRQLRVRSSLHRADHVFFRNVLPPPYRRDDEQIIQNEQLARRVQKTNRVVRF
jgi:hypothetical protein